MKRNISDLLDGYPADVDLDAPAPLSPSRIEELTMEKIEAVKTKKRRFSPRALAAAAIAAALLCGSALAAAILLTPKEVAQRAGDGLLAQAFESEEAITVNETQNVDGYAVTLMGLVSGKELAALEMVGQDGRAYDDRTYAVLSMARLDGEPVTESVPDLTVTPLVEGYAPWRLNAWVLNGGTTTFAEDGRLYYLLECDNVESFADHTVYLAVYPGTHIPPSAERFDYDAGTGAIVVKEGQACALFTLPLDPAKADPQKAQALLGQWDAPAEGPGSAGDEEEDEAAFRLVTVE